MAKYPKSSVTEIEEALSKQEKQLKKESFQRKKQRNHVRNHRGKQDHYLTDALVEDDMIAAIDFRKEIQGLKPILEKLVQDKYDPASFFSEVSKYAAAQLASVAFTGEKEKNRLDAIKHILALGGHNPTHKHEVSRLDPETPKSALMSIVRGSMKDLQAEGIEIVDDSKDYDK